MKKPKKSKPWGHDPPTGLVIRGNVRSGYHPAFVLLGWVEARKNRWPVIILNLAVLSKALTKSIGNVLLSLPFTPNTERRICVLLQDFGWDGRVWPYKDEGWPSGTSDESQLLEMLKREKLGATLTFPSDPENGAVVRRVPVKKRKGAYPIAVFTDWDNSDTLPKYLESLRGLVANPSPFTSDWS
jgi:hypothetical protein